MCKQSRTDAFTVSVLDFKQAVYLLSQNTVYNLHYVSNSHLAVTVDVTPVRAIAFFKNDGCYLHHVIHVHLAVAVHIALAAIVKPYNGLKTTPRFRCLIHINGYSRYMQRRVFYR